MPQHDLTHASGSDHNSDRIGPYRILETLGEGGMGTVFLAEQREPVRRRVAVKVIKFGMDTKEVVHRFLAERQALACMTHANIARVLDAGATAQGRPYFAMEYVQGIPIHQYCAREQLGVNARLRLFQQVCLGVQHAHQKGVVHRDLKPSNILVAVQDGTAVPKIIDFGVAKAIDHRLTEQTCFTEQGRPIGTPEYMSPEQADPTGLDIDTRSDIYALGVLLYELLTGQLPFERGDSRPGAFLELQRRIREDEPKRPSTRLQTGDTGRIAKSFATEPAALVRALRGDLDWIILRCLEKAPSRRYPTASELAADLERHLRHEPVLAGPPGVGYRVAKFLRKHRASTAAAAALVVTVLGAATFALHEASVANAAAATASAAEAKERTARLDESAQRERAERAEQAAKANAARLQLRTDEFDQLKAVVLLQRARAGVAELSPPWPDRLPAMAAWASGDAARLLESRPGLRQALTELRGRAEPWTEAERAADRRSHPAMAELEHTRQMLGSLTHANEVRSGRRQVQRPTLPAALLAAKAGVLLNTAYMRVADPRRIERTLYGEEAFGLAAAEAAHQKALDGDQSVPTSATWPLLIQALFANGLDAEAQRQAEAMLADAAPANRAALTRSMAALIDAVGSASAEQRTGALTARVTELEQQVTERRTWTFGSAADQFLHDTLADLTRQIDEFAATEVAQVAWQRRWAQRLQELAGRADYQAAWEAAQRALRSADGIGASRAYAALPIHDLPIQPGLWPIGKNPATGLWEFYDLASATDLAQTGDPGLTVPAANDYDEHGNLRGGPWPGVVFVLIPGGTFTIGAQDHDPALPHYDEDSSRTEGWPQPVTLAPFLLARTETTQGQWQRLTHGETPSVHRIGSGQQGVTHRITWENPVERVSWSMALRVAVASGMTLPTEAQWEYACRAGTTTRFSSGDEVASLAGHANIHDVTAARTTGTPTDVSFDDTHRVTAPVASFRANPWGLFDMHGNVREWCRDGYQDRGYSGIWAVGDGLTPEDGRTAHVTRGGSYADGATDVRAPRRTGLPTAAAVPEVGVRFARALLLTR